jgi:HAD superfamily hydrolase (TIGR01509 family)
MLIVAALLLYSFRTMLVPVVLASLFSYIFAPVVGGLSKLLHVRRGWAVLLLYVVGLGLVATLPAVTIPVIVEETESLLENLDAIANRTIAWLEDLDQYRFEFLGYVFTPPDIETLFPETTFDLDRMINLINSAISPLAGGAVSIVRTVASGVGWIMFMAVMAFYLMVDAEKLVPALLNFAPPAYRPELMKLVARINNTWNDFLRGQIVLCAVIGITTTIAMSAIGIRFAVALGVVAGILEIIPSLGPTLASVPAILIALFQGSSVIPLSNFGVALIVAGVYWMIQNLENNLLVPRIIGSTLNLHPIIIIVGVLAGATLGGTLGPLGGILGALLAAPVLATMRHVLRYIYFKLADLDPFPESPVFSSKVAERQVQAILFDLDGTLLDTDDMLVKRWARTLDRIPLLRRLYDGQRLARRLVMAIETPMNALVTMLDILSLDKRAFAFSEWFRLLYGQRRPEHYIPVDGTVSFVRRLSADYDLALTTTRNRGEAEHFLEAFALVDCFKAVVTRDDVKRLKPHPEPIRRAAETLGYTPEQCIVVGDTTVDVQAGRRAGALTVGVLCGFGERLELERQEADLILDTTIQLTERLPHKRPTWHQEW